MEFLKKLVDVLNDEKFRKNPNLDSSLPKKRYIALNTGAICSEKAMYYCDSLTTGRNVKKITKYLFDYYDISSIISSKRVLDWLLNRGHRAVFEYMKDRNLYVSDYERGLSTIFRDNIDEVYGILARQGYVKDKDEIMKISILPWDMARLVTVARGSYDCGYITEDECWHFIEKAYEKSSKVADSWEDMAKSYIVGKGIVYGENVDFQVEMDIASDLLNDENSPWKKYPFK